MTVPVWVLLFFAAWTLFTLAVTVGTHRWGSILSRRARVTDYAWYKIEGEGWYARGMRAHQNCVETLPVYASIVVVLVATGIDRSVYDVLAVVLMVARVLHTAVHVLFEQKTVAVIFRSTFYNIQWACMAAMAVMAALAAGEPNVGA